jgi:hypothetical protein
MRPVVYVPLEEWPKRPIWGTNMAKREQARIGLKSDWPRGAKFSHDCRLRFQKQKEKKSENWCRQA